MMNKGLSKLGLQLLDKLTDSFPTIVPQLFQRAFLGTLGSSFVHGQIQASYERKWCASSFRASHFSPLSKPEKILLAVDVCIGDAILASECLPVLRRAYPEAEIHYLCNKTGGELVEGMPGVIVHNFVRGEKGFPTREDLIGIRALVERESFSLVLNMGPFITKRTLTRRGWEAAASTVLQLYIPFAAFVLLAWKENGQRHISYLAKIFLQDFLGRFNEAHQPARSLENQLRILGQDSNSEAEPLNSNRVYLSDVSIDAARRFLRSHNLQPGGGLLFFNPDATSRFGMIPLEIQRRIIQDVTRMEGVSAVLIGQAYSNPLIEREIIASLDSISRHKLVLVPHMPIGAYVALLDACDMYISGDTGPIHIAATRKLSPKDSAPMRNKTSVVAIYGATDSRMYGYDSEQPNHVPANQDAPSRAFSAPVPCRNITCINKFGKFCEEVRCFDRLPVEEVAAYIASYFSQLSKTRALESGSAIQTDLDAAVPNIEFSVDIERAFVS